MRGLPALRIASTALCATLLVGLAGPAAVAADSARERTHAASRAPVPGADALIAQVKNLGDLGGVLTPVTDLLNAVLKADNGQLSADEAQKLVSAVKDAIAKITAAAAKTPAATPTTAATPTAPATPTTAATPTAASPSSAASASSPFSASSPSSLTKHGDDSKPPLAKDLKADALAALQKAVDALLAAITSGDVGQVVPALTGVVTGLVNFLAATLLGGGLSAPTLPGLPPLPSLPGLPVPLPVPLPVK